MVFLYKLLTYFSKLFAHIKIIIINNVQYLELSGQPPPN